MKKILTILLLIVLSISLKAQVFKWFSSVEEVDESAFYNVYLNPDITSKLRYELPDIRLFDEKNNEIPFILRLDRKNYYSPKLKKLNIIKDKYRLRKGLRQIIVHNRKKEAITNFKLILKKNDAIISLKITGSNNKKNWYILKNSTSFHTKINQKEVELFIEDIPENTFEYFNIEVTGSTKERLDVKAVYYRKRINFDRNYMQLISPRFKQDNISISGKSIINIEFKQPEFIDKIRFRFKDDDYFLRKAYLLKTDTIGEKKLNLQQYDRKKRELVFSSSKKNEFEFTNFKAQQLKLEIENQDDAPLNLISVRAYRLNAYLIAHLEAGKKYFLRFGNDNVAAPLYDLNYFTDSIPIELKTIEAGKIYPHLVDENMTGKFKLPVFILWILAFGIAGFLGYMVYRMFKAVDKKDDIFVE